MIRRDGFVIPVEIHIYGSFSNGGFDEDKFHDVKETIQAGEWLVKYAINKDQAMSDLVDLCQLWVHGLHPDKDLNDFKSLFLEDVNKKPRAMRDQSVIDAVASRISTAMPSGNENALNDKITKTINQDFLRARMGAGISTGDLYNSDTTSTECVFRVSSVGFNWFPVIWSFVAKNKNRIGYVTVVRDFESTGNEGVYSYRGLKFAQMPADEFLSNSKTPVFDSKKAKSEKSEFSLFYIPFNFNRRKQS